MDREQQIEEIRRVHGDAVAREYMNPEEIARENVGSQFQHRITGHVRKDNQGKEYIKFSTYLSFLQISFRVYLPGLTESSVRVFADFSLKQPTQNKDGSARKATIPR